MRTPNGVFDYYANTELSYLYTTGSGLHYNDINLLVYTQSGIHCVPVVAFASPFDTWDEFLCQEAAEGDFSRNSAGFVRGGIDCHADSCIQLLYPYIYQLHTGPA